MASEKEAGPAHVNKELDVGVALLPLKAIILWTDYICVSI